MPEAEATAKSAQPPNRVPPETQRPSLAGCSRDPPLRAHLRPGWTSRATSLPQQPPGIGTPERTSLRGLAPLGPQRAAHLLRSQTTTIHALRCHSFLCPGSGFWRSREVFKTSRTSPAFPKRDAEAPSQPPASHHVPGYPHPRPRRRLR